MNASNWLPRVTIRDVASWWVILLATPGGILAYLAAYASNVPTHPVATMVIAVGAMGLFFITLGVVYLASRILGRGLDSPLLALGAVIAAAVARGAVIGGAHRYVGLFDSLSWGTQIIASVLTLVPITVITASVVVALGKYRDAQHENDELETALSTLDEHAAEHIRTFTNRAIDEAHRGIEEVVNALRDSRSSHQGQTLEVVRRVSNEVVSPLSRRLRLPDLNVPRQRPSLGPPRINWKQLREGALSDTPHWPTLTGGLTGVAILPHTLATFAPPLALLVAAIWAGSITGLLWLQNLILGNVPYRTPRAIRATGIVVLATLGVVALLGAIDVLARVVTFAPITRDVLTNSALTLPASMVLVILARGLLLQIRETLALRDRMRVDLDARTTQANELFWQRRSALSHALHGPIQAALNAAELRSRSAIEINHFDRELAEELAGNLEATAAGLLNIAEAKTDLALVLERIRQTWEGLCQVRWEIPAGLLSVLSQDSASAAIADTLVEAVFNAVRHASATDVLINATSMEDSPCNPELLIDVWNNGTAPISSPSRGQGSELFDLLTQDWCLRAKENNEGMTTRLRLTILLGAPGKTVS